MRTFAYKNRGMSGTRISEYESVSAFFKALANPVRAAIVHLLSVQERTVGQLVEELGLAQPMVSQHLRVLVAPGWLPPGGKGRGSGTASATSTSPTSWAMP